MHSDLQIYDGDKLKRAWQLGLAALWKLIARSISLDLCPLGFESHEAFLMNILGERGS